MPVVAGALAAGTTSIRIGSWVMSAAQHQSGMIVRAAEALDPISGGRAVLGLGSVTKAEPPTSDSLPTRHVSRYLEALQISVPLLRGQESMTFDGQFHHVEGRAGQTSGTKPGQASR